MADDLTEHFGVPRARIVTIYNPLDRKRIAARARSAASPFAGHGPGPQLVAIGRLDPQKGFDLLLRAFPELLESEPGAELWILGEDMWAHQRNRQGLAALADELGISGRVHFEGYVENPYPYLEHADLFVLSSRYEGLPNVLLEALSLGCPVLAVDAPGGTREIMELSGQLERLVPELHWKGEWLRGRAAAREPDLSAFSLEASVAAYARVLAGSPD
jgi:glycosyltransferase involved in cell wall biosynthesis